MISIIQDGNWYSGYFGEYLDLLPATYRVGAELEEAPAKRIPWYEARVSWLKWFEQFIENRVKEDHDPPARLFVVRFQRLQAETDLLELQAAITARTAPPVPLYYQQPLCPRPRSGSVLRLFRR
jgi:hypothetical protein